jgi:hypothetical protein
MIYPGYQKRGLPVVLNEFGKSLDQSGLKKSIFVNYSKIIFLMQKL